MLLKPKGFLILNPLKMERPFSLIVSPFQIQNSFKIKELNILKTRKIEKVF